MSKRLNKQFGSNSKHLPVFKALQASNPESLLVFEAPRGDDMEENVGTIHAWVDEDWGNERSGNLSCDLRANERL